MWLRATACIGIDCPTFLGDSSLRKVGNPMPTRAGACTHGNLCRCMRQHAPTCIGIEFPTFAKRFLAQKSRGTQKIHTDTRTCAQAHGHTNIRTPRARMRGNLCRCMWLRAAACIDVDFPTLPGDSPRRKVGETNADACRCMRPHAAA